MSRCRTSCVLSARAFIGKTIDLLTAMVGLAYGAALPHKGNLSNDGKCRVVRATWYQGIVREIGIFRIGESRFIKRGLLTFGLLC